MGREFVSSDEIKSYCSTLNLSYEKVIRYFMRMKYIIRIFKGIFYVKSLEEIKYYNNNNSIKYSHLELVSKGLELKGVKNWYFGLYTALKLNNATHEYFTIDYIITDSLYRNKKRVNTYIVRVLVMNIRVKSVFSILIFLVTLGSYAADF